MCNNPNLDLVNINAYEKFGLIQSIRTIITSHNSVLNLQKWMGNNHFLDLVKVKAYAKFNQNPLMRSQDIERKQYSGNNQGP